LFTNLYENRTLFQLSAIVIHRYSAGQAETVPSAVIRHRIIVMAQTEIRLATGDKVGQEEKGMPPFGAASIEIT